MQEYGEVTNVHIPKNEEGHSRGFAFVTFRWHESAVVAMDEMEGSVLDHLILRDIRWAAPPKRMKDQKPGIKQKGSNQKRRHRAANKLSR